MSGHSVEEIKKSVKVYIGVFAALAVLTVVTVAASYLDLSFGESFFLALTIASIKGTLVAGYFMHLFTERTAILAVLGLTFFFLITIMFLPYIAFTDQAVI
ncbi:MAG: cytochrome C oxidase subunit IV family protein [Candidatus Marinimicrobia bacterium]|jgi:cytochrome c oxidase subunit 4|nr:cytochrome C oxidase subunit IV family protein [Candidatus Neomarinimicrobiota bacterium]MDP7608420.1 cytochrome C oxidase subunit IV family protein [Candidatus Neomarinimicrobiota bacterium]|tara:strand:- start:254 stop:556 length:303 start_codon:yes stop_codon:yes gene_type:complete